MRARVAISSMFPLSVMCGGLELQALKTMGALRALGVDAKLLDWGARQREYDLLHFFGSSPTFVEIARHAPRDVPLVLSAVTSAHRISAARTGIWRCANRAGRWARLETSFGQMREVYRRCSAVACLNTLERAFITSTYGVDEARAPIIPNGVEDAFFEANGAEFSERYGTSEFVLFTGNIVARKNPLLLAEVLRTMRVRGVFLGKRVAAEEAYGDAFSRLIGSTSGLMWLENIGYDDPLLPSAYAAASVFCLPSRSETQSLSALEAMATGTPVVLADRPYARQPPLDRSIRWVGGVDRLAECLERGLKLGKGGGERLPREYSWANVARRLVEIYREALSERRRD
jgi:glycosyltransferase involved in cell wall biosynthesis